MSTDPIAMCELLVGLPEVAAKDRPVVELTDLPCFGTPVVLVWRKRRWVCQQGCGSFTEHPPGSLHHGCGSPTVQPVGRQLRWVVMAGRCPRSLRISVVGGMR